MENYSKSSNIDQGKPTGLVFLHATEGAEERVLAPYNF